MRMQIVLKIVVAVSALVFAGSASRGATFANEPDCHKAVNQLADRYLSTQLPSDISVKVGESIEEARRDCGAGYLEEAGAKLQKAKQLLPN